MSQNVLDLGPACAATADVVRGIRPDQLGAPTPCAEYWVGDLLDHVAGLSVAFAMAARKEPIPAGPDGAGPSGDAARLDPRWSVTLPAALLALAEPWRDPGAYDGMTEVGGVTLPGAAAGLFGLDEVVVHGWDLAVATGQPYAPPEELVAACLGLFENQDDAGDGPFGPPVTVPDGASTLERLLALTGRDPRWTPPTHRS